MRSISDNLRISMVISRLFPNRVIHTGLFTAILFSAAVIGPGPAAGTENINQIIDGSGRTVQAVESDTRIEFVAPLDGNPLTREWFHSGKAGYNISGPGAENFRGKIVIGYQVGYPASFDGRLKFEWMTPDLGVSIGGSSPGITVNSLLPRAGVEMELGFGPGIVDVDCATGSISGSTGFIQLSAVHASVTGAVGSINIRPYVTVISETGDTVVAYGPATSH
ncbi:MspA family porin [Nocardia sp. NPDC056064]|uniref:MspA family porin n=1 Tax=Nocardia sp. NPDC056064 TaxID=3345701 RepID=UPI0035DA6C13